MEDNLNFVKVAPPCSELGTAQPQLVLFFLSRELFDTEHSGILVVFYPKKLLKSFHNFFLGHSVLSGKVLFIFLDFKNVIYIHHTLWHQSHWNLKFILEW